MSCQFESSRDAYQANLSRINAEWIAKHSPDFEGTTAGGVKVPRGTAGAKTARAGGDPDVRLRADGDADVEPGAYLGEFVVPACPRCGGILKVRGAAGEACSWANHSCWYGTNPVDEKK